MLRVSFEAAAENFEMEQTLTLTPTPERTANWTKDEELSLLELIEVKEIIKGKFGPNLTIQDKRKAWEWIHSRHSVTSTFISAEIARVRFERGLI